MCSPARSSAGVIEDHESPELARDLYRRIIRDLGVKPQFVHADNGGPMKGISLVAFLTQLEVGLTYSRPRVSDDNPFIESFFKTVKYSVGYPKVFTGLPVAREWFARFINWYNTCHRHSGIGYVTPQQKHCGADIELFSRRQCTLDLAAALLIRNGLSAVLERYYPFGKLDSTRHPENVKDQYDSYVNYIDRFRSTIITSNRDFAEWQEVFINPPWDRLRWTDSCTGRFASPSREKAIDSNHSWSRRNS